MSTSRSEQVCFLFAEAMAGGWTLPRWQHARLSALQTERGRRSTDHAPRDPFYGPVLIQWETSVADGPGALPMRLSLPVLCF